MNFFLRFMHIFNHIAVIYGLIVYSFWWFFLGLFVWFLFGCIGISITFHRYLSHKSFLISNDITKKIGVILGCLATAGSPITWVGTHRRHHLFSDKKGDPHSIKNDGWLRTYFHLWKPFFIGKEHIKDICKDSFLKRIHRYYPFIIFFYAGLLFLFDPCFLIFAYCLPATFAFHAFGLVNTFGHQHGYKNWEISNNSTNSWIANFLTWGEGWHNNHHRFPGLHRIGLLANEVDISAWVLENIPGISKNRKTLKNKSKVFHTQLSRTNKLNENISSNF